jgi:hypothetical protein
VVAAILVRPRANWRVAICLVSFALVTVPWAIRNEGRYGVFTISTIGAANLYAYNAQGVLNDGYVFGSGTGSQSNVLDQSTLPFRRDHPSTARLYARLNSATIRIISHHPAKAIVQELWGALHVMLGTGKETLVSSTGDASIPSILTTAIPLLQILAMWLLALVGLVVAWRRSLIDRSALVLMVAGIAVVILAAGGPAGYGRYRLPATPIECVLAALGVVALWRGSGVTSWRGPAGS